MAWSSDPLFRVTQYIGVDLIIHHNYDRVEQIVIIKSGAFRKLFIEELYETPLAGHLGLWNWLMHSSKGLSGPSCVRQWLSLSICTPLVRKQRTVLQSLLVYFSPFQSQNLASPHGTLVLPLIYHSLMHVTQFPLLWIASQNTQFSFLVR